MTRLMPRPVADSGPDDATPPSLPRPDPIRRMPIVILYPHNRCNCRCQMCDIWRLTGRQEITVNDVRAWIPEWRKLGVERVVLSGGEPLMHTEIADFCRTLREAEMGITLLSTGLLLARHANEVARSVDDVIVSLDGPRDVHDAIRRVSGAYEKMAAGVRAVRTRDPDIAVSGRCTVQRSNAGFLRATVHAAREVGLDRISFLAADVSTEAFNRPGGWEPDRVVEVGLGRPDLDVLAAEIDAMERDCGDEFASGFIAESPEKLRNRIYQYFAALAGEGEFAPVACNAPWVSTVVESDGTVRPCFFQPPLGNRAKAASLAEILNSPEARAWRRGLDTRRNAICRKCVCSLALREIHGKSDGGGAP